MRWYRVFLLLTVMLLSLPTGAIGQERGPLSVKEIERLVSAGVTPKRIVALVEQHGVNFELTAEVREQLRSAGADAAVLTAIEQASVAYTRKAMEEERQKIEEEKKKIEAAKQAEEKQRKAEEEKRRQEERKQAEAAKQKEAEQRKAEEERRRREEQQRAEAARRQAEEEERRKAAEAQRAGEMVAVPAGEFFMGCNDRVDTECYDDEKPGRRVSVGAFTIDKTEVTVSAYQRCVQAGACTAPATGGSCNWGQNGRVEHPVNCIDWEQARTYCTWAGKRLPKEAEWEKAARGTDGRTYPWGNSWDAARANVGSGDGTRAVGSYAGGASPYGALDMSGNVWEWTADWYDTERQYRVVRGGSWNNNPRNARASNRNRNDPGERNDNIGVRCAQEFPERGKVSGSDAARSTDGRTSVGSYTSTSWPCTFSDGGTGQKAIRYPGLW